MAKRNNKNNKIEKNIKLDEKTKTPPSTQPLVNHPIIVFFIVISCVLLMSIIFAGIKVFLVQDALLGSENIIQENGSINVIFCRQAQSNCEDKLLYELNNSKTIACAFYDLDLPRTTQLLKQKNASLLIYEDKAFTDAQKLGRNPPQVQNAISDGLMHNKFCVLDLNTNNARVITGSMNPTINDAQKNDNNLIIIRSQTLATRYAKEYNEIRSRISKAYKKNSAAPIRINLSGTLIEQRFCPQESCESTVISELQKANNTIRFMTFSFTSDPIGSTLVESHNRNINISGIFEKRQVDEWTELEYLNTTGLDVKTDNNPSTMHHKVFIIDNNTVITGSYNPTKNANTKNDENLLIIHDENIAQQYTIEFERVWGITK